MFEFGVCANNKCGYLNIKRQISEDISNFPKPCDICGEVVHKNNSFIIPEYGFIISSQANKSTIKMPERTYRVEIFYIGDEEEILQNETKKIELNNQLIKIKSNSNDELVVINTSNFYICDVCGFAKIDKKLNTENFIIDKSEHTNPYRKVCPNKKLYRTRR